jgi:hypothetical protein
MTRTDNVLIVFFLVLLLVLVLLPVLVLLVLSLGLDPPGLGFHAEVEG